MAAQVAACTGSMRQFGSALMTYAAANNGYLQEAPLARGTGTYGTYFVKSHLGADYVKELPICPTLRFDASKLYDRTQAQMVRAYGGGYVINALFLEGKVIAMPPYWSDTAEAYAVSRIPFVDEGCYGNCFWVPDHLNQTLDGISSIGALGRNHGGKNNDSLNFLFADGHIALVSRNDDRNIPPSSKHWDYPRNPTGLFAPYGNQGRYATPMY